VKKEAERQNGGMAEEVKEAEGAEGIKGARDEWSKG
jgi:hypothetical protein